jgi:hypothetical protein
MVLLSSKDEMSAKSSNLATKLLKLMQLQEPFSKRMEKTLVVI